MRVLSLLIEAAKNQETALTPDCRHWQKRTPKIGPGVKVESAPGRALSQAH